MANTQILDQQVVHVSMEDKVLTGQTLYTLEIPAGTLTNTSRIQIAATLGRIFNIVATCPESLICCPTVGLDVVGELPGEFTVAESWSGYELEGHVYTYIDTSTVTVNFSSNHRASWSGYIDANGEFYMLIADMDLWQDGYPAKTTVVHYYADGTRQQIPPITPNVGIDGFGIGTMQMGRADVHGYMVNDIFFEIGPNDEHYFKLVSGGEPGTYFCKLSDDFYMAGDGRIGASTATVRRYSYSSAGVYPGSPATPSNESVDLDSVIIGGISKRVCRSLCTTGVYVYALFGSSILVLDYDDLDLQNNIDASVCTNIRGIHAVNDDLIYILWGTSENCRISRWTSGGGIEEITSIPFNIAPAVLNPYWAPGFVNYQQFTYADGYLYLSMGGGGGLLINVVKVGVLECP